MSLSLCTVACKHRHQFPNTQILFFFRCGLLVGPDPKYDERINIDGLSNFQFTRAAGEPENDWRESMFPFFSFSIMYSSVLRSSKFPCAFFCTRYYVAFSSATHMRLSTAVWVTDDEEEEEDAGAGDIMGMCVHMICLVHVVSKHNV
jgi:hypothetical protein